MAVFVPEGVNAAWKSLLSGTLRRLALGLAALLAVTLMAQAGLTRQELGTAGFHIAPGAILPPTAILHGAGGDQTLGAALAGKPALVTFTDYRCQSLCGVVLDELAETLPKVPLMLGRDYNVISLALDSGQTQADVVAFVDRHTSGSPLHDRGLFFTNDAAALAQIEASVGLVAPFDAEAKQFAHPAGLLLVDSAGIVQRVVSPFALDPFDLKLALTQSGSTGSRAGQLVGHALLLCYGLDPATGLYTLRIERVMAIGAGLTILLLGGGIALALRRERTTRRRLPTTG